MIKTFSVQETAKLTRFPGGEYQFFEWLRKKKYLLQDNQPSETYRKRGWFELVVTSLQQSKPKKAITVPRVTIKGLAALEKAVMKEFPPCVPCGNPEKLKKK